MESLQDGDREDGNGIQFLPGDIKGLPTKLNYLFAEYQAGNRSSINCIDSRRTLPKKKNFEKGIQRH